MVESLACLFSQLFEFPDEFISAAYILALLCSSNDYTGRKHLVKQSVLNKHQRIYL